MVKLVVMKRTHLQLAGTPTHWSPYCPNALVSRGSPLLFIKFLPCRKGLCSQMPLRHRYREISQQITDVGSEACVLCGKHHLCKTLLHC